MTTPSSGDASPRTSSPLWDGPSRSLDSPTEVCSKPKISAYSSPGGGMMAALFEEGESEEEEEEGGLGPAATIVLGGGGGGGG